MSVLLAASVASVASWAPQAPAPPPPAPDDWPCWRGADGTGVSAEADWDPAGGAEPLWERAVGRGQSSSAVVGGRLYTCGFELDAPTADGDGGPDAPGSDVVWCLDAASGEVLWTHRYPALLRAHGHGGGTLTTPAVHDGCVYQTNREGAVRCLDAATGELLWRTDLAAELGVAPLDYGFGGSPLVLEDRVVVNARRTVALDRATGEVLWATRDHLALYSTPARFTLGGEPRLLVFSKEGLALLDPADGAFLAQFPFRKGSTTVNAATPVVVGERAFVSSGYSHGAALVEFAEDGPRALWESRVMRTKLSGAVLVGEHLYGFDESLLKCIGLDGEERWRKRGLGQGALCAAGGRLVVQGGNGELAVAEASPEGWRELARAPLFRGGSCWSTPVLADGRLYLRDGQGRLVCLDRTRR